MRRRLCRASAERRASRRVSTRHARVRAPRRRLRRSCKYSWVLQRFCHNPFPHLTLADHRLHAIRRLAAGFEQPPAFPAGVDEQVRLKLIREAALVELVEMQRVVENGLDGGEAFDEIGGVSRVSVEFE